LPSPGTAAAAAGDSIYNYKYFILFITVATLNIEPNLDFAELSGKFWKLTLFSNSGFIEVKVHQRSEIGNIPCNLMQGKFDRHNISKCTLNLTG
jgi:hypothetical protein